MSLTAVWELLKIFGPFVLILGIVSSPPVTRLYNRYVSWVYGKTNSLVKRLKVDDESRVHQYVEQRLEILEVWYNVWMEKWPEDRCPLSWLRNASCFKHLHYRVEPESDSIVFTYRGFNAERRWPLKTIDLEK